MIGAPANLPDDVRATLTDAVRTAFESEGFSSFMKDRGFALTWMDSDDAKAFHASEDKAICEVMKAAGMI